MTIILLIILLAIQSQLDIKFPVYIWVINGIAIFGEITGFLMSWYAKILGKNIENKKENEDKTNEKIS